MSSPAVWDDAWSRALASATAQGLALVEVAMQDTADHEGIYLMFETRADSSESIELSGLIWQELGQIWVHVMVPTSTGTRPALVVRKAIATTFRAAQSLPTGLVYLGMAFAPPESATDIGNWARLSLAIDYRYQDITTQGET